MKQIINIFAAICCFISIANAEDLSSKNNASNTIAHKKIASSPTATTSPKKVIESATLSNKKGLITINTPDCAPDSACDLIVNTSNSVLTAVNKGLTPQKTHNLIQNIVIPQFDFTLMTKYAMGNNWKLATPEQQKKLVKLFQDLLIFTYSSALSRFKDADISINNVSYRKTTASIMTQVILPNSQNNQAINVEYDLVGTTNNDKTTWKAYDIKIETSSLVTIYRTQFNEVIQSNQVEGLIAQLQNKVNNLKKINGNK